MSYELEIFVDENIALRLRHESFADLTAEFAKMGGDPDWLVNSVKSAVASSLHGEAVRVAVRSLGGSVISDEPAFVPEPAEEIAPPPSAPASDDPWGAPTQGESASAPQSQGDPWGGGNSQPAQSAPQQPTQNAAAPAQSSGSSIEMSTDKFGREWTTGLPDAPTCGCGDKAVRMKAKSKNGGKWYTKWKCAKGNTSDYRNKCAYDEFTS